MVSGTTASTAPPIAEDLAGAIGNPPLIRLRRASEATGCAILDKLDGDADGTVTIGR